MSRTLSSEPSYSVRTPNISTRRSRGSDGFSIHSPHPNLRKLPHSNYETRRAHEDVPALDIRDIDHEAIRNDPELRSNIIFKIYNKTLINNINLIRFIA